MSLKETIIQDMKDAMRAKDVAKLGTIRLLTAAIKQKEVDERVDVTDDMIYEILRKMTKQRRDSIAQFQAGSREDLVAIEQQELAILLHYMPQALSEEEVKNYIHVALTELKAQSIKDMGRVMAFLKEKLLGRTDMQTLSSLVKAALEK